MPPALTLHFAVTWMLAGFIWVIQVLVYPQFLRVGEAGFGRYHFSHCLRVGLMIVPLLFVEAATAAWLLLQGHREPVFAVSVGLIPVNWVLTAVFQAPLHVKLMAGFDAKAVRQLIFTNWLRTLTWMARGVLLVFLVVSL
jgi:hypothetical protein